MNNKNLNLIPKLRKSNNNNVPTNKVQSNKKNKKIKKKVDEKPQKKISNNIDDMPIKGSSNFIELLEKEMLKEQSKGYVNKNMNTNAEPRFKYFPSNNTTVLSKLYSFPFPLSSIILYLPLKFL